MRHFNYQCARVVLFQLVARTRNLSTRAILEGKKRSLDPWIFLSITFCFACLNYLVKCMIHLGICAPHSGFYNLKTPLKGPWYIPTRKPSNSLILAMFPKSRFHIQMSQCPQLHSQSTSIHNMGLHSLPLSKKARMYHDVQSKISETKKISTRYR